MADLADLGVTAVIAVAAFKYGGPIVSSLISSFIKRNERIENKIEEIEEDKPCSQPCPKLIEISTLFDSFLKNNTEIMANIHNGLNTNAHAIKEMEQRFGDEMKGIEKEIVRLATIIDERIPKK